jgi:hypothetical protein
MKKLIQLVAVILVAFLVATLLMSSNSQVDTIKGITVTSVDFRPASGGWNMNCPNHAVTWDDVKFYKVRVDIKEPVNKPLMFRFFLKAGGHLMGIVDVNFAPNATWSESTSYKRIADGAGSGVRPPSGTPSAPYTDGFWLCCTQRCKVKGNDEKYDGSTVSLYMELFSLTMDGIESVIGLGEECNPPQGKTSPRHTIKCID